MPSKKSRWIFNLFENSPKYRKLKFFQKLSAFFRFCSEHFVFCRIFAEQKRKTSELFFGYSVVKYHKKRKRAATFPVSPWRTFASPLLKQFLSSTTR